MLRKAVPFSYLIVPALLIGVGMGVRAADQSARPSQPSKVADLTLQDLNGTAWSLAGNAGKKGTVLAFVSSECPMSNDYLPVLLDLAQKYADQGIAFAAINANVGEDAKQIAAHAKEYRLTFPLLIDDKQVALDALKCEVNPEVFLLDPGLVVRYRGRIDDNYSARLKKTARVDRQDLKEAIDELLAGKPISVPTTKALGCTIQRKPNGKAVASSDVTYCKDVAPIIQTQCQGCHRPGEVGPFSLMTYRHAVKWADDVNEYVQNRKMPPWKPVGSDGMFRDERGLTEAEIATIAKWVDGGMKEGDPRDLPPARSYTDGWQLGEPDLVVEFPEEMVVGAHGRDLFRCVVMPTNLTEDKFVMAYEVRPSNRRVVHHTLNFIDNQEQGRKLEAKEKERVKKSDEQDRGPGYSVSMGIGFQPRMAIGGWAPGQNPKPLPDGVGYYLPKGSDVVVQMHYHRTGKEERDRTRIGFYFAKKPVAQVFQAIVLPGRFIGIPANNDDFKVQGDAWVDQEVTLRTIMPHMHLLGRTIKTTMTLPDGTVKDLVWIKDWDYNWQETYFLKEPIKVPAGTRFHVEAHYDNSSKNPLNPFNPPKNVRFGEQTTDEMCFVFLGATSDKAGRISTRYVPSKKEGAQD